MLLQTAKDMTVIEINVPEMKISDMKVSFNCASCSQDVTCSMEDIFFEMSEAECELCGSHGEKEISFSCPACNKYFKIETASW